jgi:hypothetical protein
VLGAVGGSGRSTVAGLLAAGLAHSGSAAVVDTAPRLSSPWPQWVAEPGAGLASIPPDLPLTRAQALAAASPCAAGSGPRWQVLTDHQEWGGAPLQLPEDPAAWHQLAAAAGWQSVIADTAFPVAHDIVSARWTKSFALTAAWSSLPFSVPVLCAAATASGMHALQTAVSAISAEGMALQRMVAVLVSTGEGRSPASVRAGETMLRPRVSALVRVPFDPQIRAYGLRDPSRLGSRSLEASAELASAVLASAHHSWGDPLPAAAVPAALDSVYLPSLAPVGAPVPIEVNA